MNKDQIEAERKRLYKLVDGFIEKYLESEDTQLEEGSTNMADRRFDTVMIGGIMVGEDEDGDDVEASVAYFETRRRYAQLGLLNSLVERQTREYT